MCMMIRQGRGGTWNQCSIPVKEDYTGLTFSSHRQIKEPVCGTLWYIVRYPESSHVSPNVSYGIGIVRSCSHLPTCVHTCPLALSWGWIYYYYYYYSFVFSSLGQFSLLFAAICGISEPTSQIWGVKPQILEGIYNILVFTFLLMVFNDVWMVFIDFLMVFSDVSMVSEICSISSMVIAEKQYLFSYAML